MVAQKNVIRAYWLAFVGLLCGIVGMHRFYLELYFTGTLCCSYFLAASFALPSDWHTWPSPFQRATRRVILPLSVGVHAKTQPTVNGKCLWECQLRQ
ncbi:MAG: hypothetical protein ACNYPH_03875 [Gammaproteobacteria bacterium WSBS_2016_MAG_OTU1]